MEGRFFLMLLLPLCITVVSADFLPDLSDIFHNYKTFWDRMDDQEISRMGWTKQALQADEFYLTQPLDHFEVQTTRTYQQRYLVVDDYWEKTNGPVFLYIAGEWELSPGEVTNGHFVDMAKSHGALILGVEHRFYGKSVNTDGMELDQLNYLSSHQALADLVSFHAFATNKFELTKKNLWISFGCSYPGALSAWFRLKYPHLVHGAVSSSGPVRAEANFQGYYDVVTSAFGDPAALGSEKCVSRIVAAFDKLDTMVKNSQFSEIQQAFNICRPLSDPNDRKLLASTLQGRFATAVQYNVVYGVQSQVGIYCSIMTNETIQDPFDALRSMVHVAGDCIDVSYDYFVDYYRNTSFIGATRSWLYQTCTQYGYYQTCDSETDCMFLDIVDLDFYLKFCKDLYAIEGPAVLKHVDFTNMYYGADKPWGSRILFVNGDLDPWHALGVKEDLSESMKAILIRGASHCRDIYSPTPFDSVDLKAGRLAIEEEVKKWLQSPGFYREDCSGNDALRRSLHPALLTLGLLVDRIYKLSFV